jgi:hypothetical protein
MQDSQDRRDALTQPSLRSPRSAAAAGIVFSLLMLVSLVLIRIAVPAVPQDEGDWLTDSQRAIGLALNLVPFAGIAFLWFVGVIRDRLGAFEDRLFATVFLGSGLLFLAMLFAAAAVTGGILITYGERPSDLIGSDTYDFGRGLTYLILNIYAMKMAGVFMISSCTLLMRTRSAPRWIAYLGYALALILLVTITRSTWVAVLFPLWVLLLSSYILIDNYRGGRTLSATETADKA